MENQPTQPPNKPSPPNAEGCQKGCNRGCLIVVAIFAALLLIGLIISGNHDHDNGRSYPGQPPSAGGGG